MKNGIKRVFDEGTMTTIDGYHIEGAPEWANGAIETKRMETKQADDGTVTDTIWISTQHEDRSGDIVIATGVRFDDYFKNPVVGWNHGFGSIDFPIGKTTSLDTVAGTGIAAQWDWPPWKHISPEMGIEAVDDIHRLWSGHFINAASIWFKIITAEIREGHEDDWWPPLIVHECSLMEWALVYVPDNQDAVRRSIKQIGQLNYLKRLNRNLRQKSKRNVEYDNLVGQIRNITIPIGEIDSFSKSLNSLNNSLNNLKGEFNV